MNAPTDFSDALEAQDLCLSRGALPVLRKLSFRLPPGSRRLLLGPSGAGKTSLLRLIAGLERPESGSLQRSAELWASKGRNHKPPDARRVGMVFQDLALWPAMSALEQLLFVSPQGRKAARAEAEKLLQSAGLAGLGDRRPAELSGGEQQRLAVLRALAQRPDFLVLDEATAQLDAMTRREVLALVLEALQERPTCSLIAVSHQLDEASFLSEDLWVLNQGQLIYDGPLQAAREQPDSAELARCLDLGSLIPARLEGGQVHSILGPLSLDDLLIPETIAGQASIQLLLRPEQLRFVAAENGPARVLGLEQRAASQDLVLRLDDFMLRLSVQRGSLPGIGTRGRIEVCSKLQGLADPSAAAPGQ